MNQEKLSNNTHQQDPAPREDTKTKDRLQRLKKALPWIAVVLILFAVSLITFRFITTRLRTPSWKGLKPGQATKENVIETLGKPQDEKQLDAGKALFYPSEIETLPNTVILGKDSKVDTILLQLAKDDLTEFEALVEKYGKPQKEMFNSISQQTKTYIFAKHGVIIVGNKILNEVYQMQYVKPMSVKKYLNTWGKGLYEKSPYKL